MTLIGHKVNKITVFLSYTVAIAMKEGRVAGGG